MPISTTDTLPFDASVKAGFVVYGKRFRTFLTVALASALIFGIPVAGIWLYASDGSRSITPRSFKIIDIIGAIGSAVVIIIGAILGAVAGGRVWKRSTYCFQWIDRKALRDVISHAVGNVVGLLGAELASWFVIRLFEAHALNGWVLMVIAFAISAYLGYFNREWVETLFRNGESEQIAKRERLTH